MKREVINGLLFVGGVEAACEQCLFRGEVYVYALENVFQGTSPINLSRVPCFALPSEHEASHPCALFMPREPEGEKP